MIQLIAISNERGCAEMSFCRWQLHPHKIQSLPKYASKYKPLNDNISNQSIVGRKKTSVHIRMKGSYTLEMAVILPLAAVFLTVVLFFFRVLQVQTQVQESLVYASRRTAAQAGSSDTPLTLMATAEVLFRKELRQHDEYMKYVADRAGGVSLVLSDVSGAEVTLRADYFVRLPIAFFHVKGIRITQYSTSRKWTGDNTQWTDTDYVYMTEHGSVYHCDRGCNYLDLSIRAAKYSEIRHLRNKSDHKYNECDKCVAKISNDNTIYITDYGDCYHTALSCSGLKRIVYLVPLADTGGKPPCSKCSRGKSG